MAAGDLFKKAAAYRKKHPGMSMPEAVKACSKKSAAGKKKKAPAKKKTARKKTARKKAAVSGTRKHKKRAAKKTAPKKAAAPRKLKIKYKPGKKGGSSITIGRIQSISGVSLDKTRQELQHQAALKKEQDRHKASLKTKGLSAGEKARIQREIENYGKAIKTSKQHITALKRSI